MRTEFENVVIVGAGGMLARAFRERIARADSAFPSTTRFLDRAACDIADASSVRHSISDNVDLVVNCAAYTNVDGAESDEAGATRINGEGVGVLASRCAEVGATLVHFSTDYVFDGKATSPYRVEHPRAPLGAYGRSKLAGELALEASKCDWLCLRTSWLYAPWGKNFVLTIAKFAREKESLRVVHDQRGRPTSCETLAWITERMLAQDARGMRHATDGGECTWFEFAREIGAAVNPACRVEPCTTAEFPRPAPRPPYSVLDLSLTEGIVGPIPDWRDALGSTLDRLAKG